MVGGECRTECEPGPDGVTTDKRAGEYGTELECEGAFAGARGTGDDDERGEVCHAGIITCVHEHSLR